MATEKQTEVTIDVKTQAFPRTMPFNRVGIQSIGSFRIFYFGLLDDEDYVQDSYACAIDEATIQRQKEDLLGYVARAGTATPPGLTMWRPKISAIGSVDVANLIRGARIGAIAELRLFNYAMGDVIDAQREHRDTVEGVPVALLRCDEALQRAMFLSLYADHDEKK
jgi:hypothetical protein